MKKFGFSGNERLKKSGEFVRVLRGGKKSKHRFLTVTYKEQSTIPLKKVKGAEKNAPRVSFPLRVGIVVPKRIFKRAHDRNQFKRWIRETWRLEKGRIKPGFDVVIQMHAIPENPDFWLVQQEILFFLEKSGLIKK